MQKIKVFLEQLQKEKKSKKRGLFTLSGQSADLLRPECRGGGRNAESRKVGKWTLRCFRSAEGGHFLVKVLLLIITIYYLLYILNLYPLPFLKRY